MKIKRLLGYLLIISILISVAGVPSASAASQYCNLIVNYINVGESDCVLIQSDKHNMLIDAGNNDDGDDIVKYLNTKKVKELDYIICTHPHADHIGGMDDVVKSVTVDKAIMADLTNDTETYRDLEKSIQEKKIPVVDPNVGNKYVLGKAFFTIIGPTERNTSNINDNSVAIRLINGKTSFIFIGDSEKEEIEDILKNKINLDSDVYMCGHHGSDTSTTAELLDRVTPKYAIISVGKNNYGHPGDNTLALLAKDKIATYRTDENGTITAISTGTKITFNARATKLDYIQNQVSNVNDNIVYVTKTGTKYHRADCPMLKSSKIEMTLKEAKAKGYTPCNKCNPPD